jgi:hypothetical protein
MICKLTVYQEGSEFFATRSFPDQGKFSHPNEIFSIEKELNSEDALPLLHEEAKAKARELGIKRVINLD